jgi:cyclomaltodextrinase
MAMAGPPEPSILPEFIFGALSTTAGRVRQARLTRSGLRHPVERQVLVPAAGEPLTITAEVGPDVAVASLELRWSTDPSLDPAAPGSLAPGVMALPMARVSLTWDDLAWGCLERWSTEIPGHGAGTPIFYAIWATTTTGERIGCPFLDPGRLPLNLEPPPRASELPPPGPRTYATVVGRQPIPEWLREAVIYQVFVDRFAPDPGQAFASPDDLAGFYGGTLRGLTSRLDHLQQLGITCLWLTPIFPSPSHHGYDPIDPGAIEPRLGTLADWDSLVGAARGRGMRLLLDYVVNHVSSEHPQFQAAQADPSHPAVGWFRFRSHPHDYDCFFDVPGQPELNSDHPQVRSYFLEHARFWLQQGCDGFRLDYAANVSHAFWSLFRAGIRATNAEAITLGEITQPPAVMRSYIGRMDGCLDFRLLELLRAFFAHRTLTVTAFAHAIEQHIAYFGSDLVLPSFLDNHDMNRFLFLVGGDKRRLKLAAFCQFTLPQPPILYYGTEVGLSQRAAVGRLEESRLPMLWGPEQDGELLDFFQALIAFRHATPCLRHAPRQSWLLDDARHLYGVACGDLALLINNSEQPATVILPRGWRGAELALATLPLESSEGDEGTLRLHPWGGVALQLRPGSPSPPVVDPPSPWTDPPGDG